jgi:hypothetical protein
LATDLIGRDGADGADMHTAMAELAEVYGLQIAWFGADVAEIRWHGGVTQTDQPEARCGSHVGHGRTCVQVPDPDAHYSATLHRGGRCTKINKGRHRIVTDLDLGKRGAEGF